MTFQSDRLTKVEAKVGNFIKDKGIEIENFQADVKLINGNGKGMPLGDIDVSTKSQFIEIKKSNSKDINDLLRQLDKYVNPDSSNFFNFSKKEVILYYDNILDMSNINVVNEVEKVKSKGILVVNGLEELSEVLK